MRTTIVEAIKQVLTDKPEGLMSSEIYEKIVEMGLYDFRAENPVAVVNSVIRRHCEGLDFPSANSIKHFTIAGYSGSKPQYTVLGLTGAGPSKKGKANQENLIQSETNSSEVLPEEIIQSAYEKHLSSLREQLMQAILDNEPRFFEQLIVDLLIAMGYGYDKASGIVVGGAHDGGIDGIIYEDKLGLDQIYLQAKRYKDGNSVGRKELQAFVGAMQSVQKGVFITTSSFTHEATTYAQNQQQKSLKLIDGNMLADLMIRHEVGIMRAAKPIVVYKLDVSYFG